MLTIENENNLNLNYVVENEKVLNIELLENNINTTKRLLEVLECKYKINVCIDLNMLDSKFNIIYLHITNNVNNHLYFNVYSFDNFMFNFRLNDIKFIVIDNKEVTLFFKNDNYFRFDINSKFSLDYI